MYYRLIILLPNCFLAQELASGHELIDDCGEAKIMSKLLEVVASEEKINVQVVARETGSLE